MDAHDFIRYLEQPELLASTPFAELERLTEEYPYFPNLHLLILLKARREQHPKLSQYLSQFAAATFDRPHLYNLLHRLDQQAEVGDTLELIALEELELLPLAASTTEELPSRLNEISVTPPFPTVPTPTAPQRQQRVMPPRPRQYVHWVATAAAFTELLPIRVEATRQRPQSAGLQDLTHFAPIVSRYRKTAPLHTRLERLRWQPAVAAAARESPAAQPIVSETLADLLVRQEQYGHAIRMYERLQLRYPEKKAIFAARIQELKEL